MKVITHPLFIVLFTLCIVAFSIPMFNRDRSTQNKQEQIQQLTVKNSQLQAQKEALEYQKLLSEQPITQEKVLRDQLWLQKPGEVILNLSEFEAPDELPPTILESELSAWTQWQKLLFKS